MESLIERIEQGMATAEDAVVVARLIGRLMRYESALRAIAVHGDGEPAMRALTALVETCDAEERLAA